MSVFSNRVSTTVQTKIMPKVVDTVLNSNVFFSRMLVKAKKWSGEQMKFPIFWEAGTSGSSFSGYDTFDTSVVDNRINLTFDPKFYQIGVSLPLTEVSVNATEEKVMDLIKSEADYKSQQMASEVGSLLYSDGLGNGSKDFLGLAAIDDDGTSAATYGGLARSTYTTLKSTVTASGGTLTLAKMDTLYDAISSGSQTPTVGITTKAVWSFYGQLLNPMQRINRSIDMSGNASTHGGSGWTTVDYRGIDILSDEKATTGVLFFLNENYLDFYALPFAMSEPILYDGNTVEGNDYSSAKVRGLGFSWTGFKKPINSAAIVGQIMLGGQLISQNPKRHGKLTGITGI